METNAVIAAGALAAAVPLPAAAAAQSNGIGYYVLTSNGGVHNYGTPWYGSDAGKLPIGMTATGFAADPATGGYWILKSDGGSGRLPRALARVATRPDPGRAGRDRHRRDRERRLPGA